MNTRTAALHTAALITAALALAPAAHADDYTTTVDVDGATVVLHIDAPDAHTARTVADTLIDSDTGYCVYEDGNPDGSPCYWRHNGELFYVTSENYGGAR